MYAALTLTLPLLLMALSPIALAFEKIKQAEEIQTSDKIEVIEVNGRRNQANTEMTAETEKLIRVAGIENDPVSSVFSMPGVVYAGGDDGGVPAIRGSSPDDNAFYIDDLPADYIFHLFGDSIFNENLVRDFTLYPAAFGSSYGNATGGVFDVKLRDPRNQDLSTTLDLSMLKAGIMLESGVGDDQAFYLSYRRSTIELFLPEGEEEDGIKIIQAPASDDYQGKYQWLIGDNQKLTFSMAGASDSGGLNISAASEEGRANPDSIGDLKLATRFDQQGLSWQYFGDNDQSFLASFGHMTQKNKQKYGAGQFLDVDEQQLNLRLQYQTKRLNSHQLLIGLDANQSDVDYSYDLIPYFCTDHDTDCESSKGDRVQDSDNLKNTDVAAYISDLWRINDLFEVEMGLRAERNDYTKQRFVHPRFAVNVYPTNDLKIFAKAGSYSRFPDIDTALKTLGNPAIASPKATHYSVGAKYEFADIWSTSVDVYYKDLQDMARSIEAGDPHENLHYTADLSGSAQGVEWVVNRELANGWYGWASISWSKSERTDDISQVTTEYYLDTPILANAVVNYQLNERWDFGMRFTLRSGQKYTPITGLRDNPDYDGHYLPVYGELNSKTLPTYTRVDLEANYKTTMWGNDAVVTFAVLNATASDNISGYYYEPDGNETKDNFIITGEKGLELYPSVGVKMQF